MMDEIQRLRTEAAQIECLYELDELLRNGQGSDETLYASVLHLTPRGFRFPDNCKVSLSMGELFIENRPERETQLKISENLNIDGGTQGAISVSYIKAMRMEKGAFLPSERRFLRSIADKLSDYLLINQLRKTIREQSKEDIHEAPSQYPEEFISGLRDLNMPVETVLDGLQTPVKFKKGEMLNKQGSDNPYLYLLGQGYIKNYIETGGERKLVFKIVSPVDWIGTPLISGRTSLFFSSVAITDALVYPVHKDDIARMEDDVAGIIHQRFLVSMENNYSRLARLMTSQSLGRIAIVIRYLSETVFSSPLIPAVISRRDIADMAGMSTESAVRMLSILRNDRIIQSGSQGIEVVDTRMLATISQAG